MIQPNRERVSVSVRNAFLLAFAATAWFGCTSNPTRDTTDNSKQVAGKKKSKSDIAEGLLKTTATSVSAYHQNILSEDEVGSEAASQDQTTATTDVKVEVGLDGMGSGAKAVPAQKPAASGKPGIVTALLKTSGNTQGTVTAMVTWSDSPIVAGSDSSWFAYQDSSRGFIEWIRAFAFDDGVRSGTGRDSIVYKWPYVKANPSALFHYRSRLYADGESVSSAAYDDDGDGILNEAPAGKTVRMKKVFISALKDTLKKSITYTDHGQTTYYDSIGVGKYRSWTDSLFVQGKPVWWSKTYDGDGDGFVLTAAPAPGGGEGKIKIQVDSYAQNPDGTYSYYYETFGPGPDKDYFKSDDNDRYDFSILVVNAKGENVVRRVGGDADGDGYYWSAAAKQNLGWETAVYENRPGFKAYRDSVVKVLNGPGEADDQIAFYAATAEYADGRTSVLTTRNANGKLSFGEKDTVDVREKFSFLNYAPTGSADSNRYVDSTLREAHLVPNQLQSPDDDQLTWWSLTTYFKAGLAIPFRSVAYTPKAPMPVHAAADAGILETLEKFTESRLGHYLIRHARWQEFDKGAATSSWRDVRYFADGDSAVDVGYQPNAGTSGYVTTPDKNTRRTGSFNASTHAFEDTVDYLDAKAGGASREIRWGSFDRAQGTGDYFRKKIYASATGSVDSGLTRILRAKGGDGSIQVTVFSGAGVTTGTSAGADIDTVRIRIYGDSAACEHVSDSVKTTFASVRSADGSYAIKVTAADADIGTLLVTGAVDFVPAGAGSGNMVQYENGTAKSPVPVRKVSFDRDGTTYLDSVKIGS